MWFPLGSVPSHLANFSAIQWAATTASLVNSEPQLWGRSPPLNSVFLGDFLSAYSYFYILQFFYHSLTIPHIKQSLFNSLCGFCLLTVLSLWKGKKQLSEAQVSSTWGQLNVHLTAT